MSVTRNVLWKRRSALFCFVLMGGVGAEELIFPKAQNPFRRKSLRELVPRVLQETPKRVNRYLEAIPIRSDAPHRARRMVGRVMQLARRGECAPPREL